MNISGGKICNTNFTLSDDSENDQESQLPDESKEFPNDLNSLGSVSIVKRGRVLTHPLFVFVNLQIVICYCRLCYRSVADIFMNLHYCNITK